MENEYEELPDDLMYVVGPDEVIPDGVPFLYLDGDKNMRLVGHSEMDKDKQRIIHELAEN